VRIARPAEEVWGLAGDPARVHEWFPGISSCQVDRDKRMITTAAGHVINEKILTVDPLQRRFQHEADWPMCRHHLGTLDVIELDEQSCLVVYGTDAEPATMALVIGGATGAALDRLREVLEEGD
jgi:hypothetical protein